MSGFKEPDFLERQEAAAIAKKAALEKFRAKTADPALADRLTERKWRGTPAMLPANRALNACNHLPPESTSWRLSSLRTARRPNWRCGRRLQAWRNSDA
jgi:Family of unknown function (DUF6481)